MTTSKHSLTSQYQLVVKTSPHVFIYNRTFAEKSDAADNAWSVLFPRQAGYFTHPTVAPNRSTFSVYHYLHCLVCLFLLSLSDI